MTHEQLAEILDKHEPTDSSRYYYNRYEALEAMNEAADQQTAEKDTQLKDLRQQLSSLKASMDILVDDNEMLSKRGMRWVKAKERMPDEDLYPVCIKGDGGGAPFYKTACGAKDIEKAITQASFLYEIEWLKEQNLIL